jgi:hypothetical protein
LVVPKCGCYEANSPIYDKNIKICISNFKFNYFLSNQILKINFK